MQLTSASFLVVCASAAVMSPVLTLLLWSQIRGAPVLRVAQRLGMIAVCQVTALAVVAVLVNNYFFFYSSWSDLLGRSQVGTITSINAVPRTMAAEASAIAVARKTGQRVRGGGITLNQTFVGTKTRLSTPAVIYLPPQYFQPKYAHTRFPVVLVFPGYPGNPPIYFTQLPIASIMQAEVSAGRAHPFIAVVVKETVTPPRDTECANVVNGPQVESFLAVEIRDQLQHVLRTRTDRDGWAMMGSSTGGFCAVKMVMRHPDLYGAAVGLSGYYRALLDNTTGALYGGSKQLQNENSPLWRLQHLPAPPVAVLATISRQERTYPQTVALMSATKAPMRLSTLISPTGGHNTHTYGAVLPQAIDWLDRQFQQVTPGALPVRVLPAN